MRLYKRLPVNAGTGFILLYAGFFVLCNTTLKAQQDSTQYTLPDVIIDAAKGRIGQNSTTIQVDSLGRWGVIGTGAEAALRTMEGLYIRDYGGQGGIKTLSLRGFAANQTSITLDGVPYESPLTGSVNLGHFLLEGFSRIEVTRATAPMNRNPLAGNVGFSAEPIGNYYRAKISGGSFGQYSALVQSVRDSGSFAYNLAALSLKAQDNYPFTLNEMQGNRLNAQYAHHQALVSVQTQLSPATALLYRGIGIVSNQGVPGAVVKGNIGNSTESLAQAEGFHFMQVRQSRNNGYQWLTLRHQYAEMKYATITGLQAYITQSAWVEYRWAYKLGKRHACSWNTDAAYTHLHGNNLAKANQPIASVTRNELNTNIQYQYKTQYKGWNSSTQANFRINLVTAFKPLYNAALYTELNRKWFTTRIEISRGQRVPSFNELYYLGYGNSSLKPEDARNLTLSVLLAPHRTFSFRLAGFQNGTWNRILSVPISPARWSTQTIGYTQTKGLEAAANWQILPQLNLNTAYTYQHSKDQTFGRFVPYAPQEILAGGTQWQHPKGYYAAIQVLWVSWRYSAVRNDEADYLPPYSLVDVRLGKLFHYKRWYCDLNADCTNALDTQYVVIQSYPMLGRAFRVQASIYFR